MNIKYDLLKQPLELTKTHDFCASGQPRLTVVLIHGIASDSSAFRNALTYLEGTQSMTDMRFVAFDLLGAGKSYKSDKLRYGYTDQLAALERSIEKLHVETPLILLGHSMGTLIATRYAATHKKAIRKLLLCSPPIYTEDNLNDPAFEEAMQGFKAAVSAKDRGILKDVAFNSSMEQIVKNRKNYKTLATLTTPAALIYGDEDPFIAAFNIPEILKENPKYLTAIKTLGKHGMSRDKYGKVRELLEEELNDEDK